eukprot:g4194.t1
MNSITICALLSIAFFALHSQAAFCNGAPDPNAKPNLNAVYTSPPRFVRSVPNASLFHVGEGDDTISIVHLWGSPYEKGFAHGTLMKDEMKDFFGRAYVYFQDEFVQAINSTVPWIPAKMADWVARLGLDVALDLTADVTRKYTGEYFFDQMRGMADATGVEYKTILRVHLIGELTKGSCSMYGAWNEATEDGKTLQMRALDWDTDGPFQDYPEVTIYHAESQEEGSSPTSEKSFANVGWTGWIGSITGMSEAQTAISEIGVSFPDSTFGKESRFGVPFTFLLRDILQFDHGLDDAMNRIKSSSRTCDLILGVGDGKLDTSSPSGVVPFRGIQYSHSVANFFTDANMAPHNDSWHAKIPSMVYYGMDWLCPNFSRVLHRQLSSLHGKLSPSNTIRDVVPIVQTGDLHIAVYDLTDSVMYVANARGTNETGPQMAYDRAFTKLDMKALFGTAKPDH